MSTASTVRNDNKLIVVFCFLFFNVFWRFCLFHYFSFYLDIAPHASLVQTISRDWRNFRCFCIRTRASPLHRIACHLIFSFHFHFLFFFTAIKLLMDYGSVSVLANMNLCGFIVTFPLFSFLPT